jgi:hypothetical protein
MAKPKLSRKTTRKRTLKADLLAETPLLSTVSFTKNSTVNSYEIKQISILRKSNIGLNALHKCHLKIGA